MNVSYPDVRAVAQNDHGIIPTEVCIGGGKVCVPFTGVCTEKPKKCFNTGKFKTGLEPEEVRQVLARWEGGNAKLSTRASFGELKARIQEGKPVLTLLRVGSFKPAGGIFGTWPEMHWVTVHGFNETTQKIYYTDTQDNSVVRPQSYSEFQGQWDWSIGDGLANETIWGKGIRPKTMVWVDRVVIDYEERTRQLYRSILGREPDPSGFRDNVNAMRQNGFEWVRAGIAGSQESRNNINNMYRQYLCRNADSGGMDHHINLLASGQMALDQIRNGIANGAEAQQHKNGCR
jgi:hypothetical protein